MPRIAFDNSYARLPARFYARLAPTPVSKPGLLRINGQLARELGLDPDWLASDRGLAFLAGNAIPDGAEPLAQAYAGHQFGGWSPQLGDGRALLLGEVIDRARRRRDIQLKGAGPTPFSRMGDGRAWLGPVLREYIMSEAMHALGIPTTRALAAVTTGDPVYRETALPGAILARVASSHVRIGTFQFFAARQDQEALGLLFDHVVARHYPEAETALDLLHAVIAAQARLIAQWMSVGFIHGVMNTDNMTLSGETIDYGPCAFLDAYVPDKVFSSIDRFGRYAYDRQPDIGTWNLAQFATALLPLIHEDRNVAIERAGEAIHRFPDLFRMEWLSRFRGKLGLETQRPDDEILICGLLDRMAANGADFTNTFRALLHSDARTNFASPETFDQWRVEWVGRLDAEGASPASRATAMNAVNPALHPRNHLIEAAIAAAVQGDLAPFHVLSAALTDPYEETTANISLRRPPTREEEVHHTFCGT